MVSDVDAEGYAYIDYENMEYLQEGGTKIVYTAPIDVTPGILCTDGIHKARPVYSNGNITWEVVP